jgi:hypothetical protein
MLRASIPVRFQKAWAVNAAGAYIRTVPVASQIGIQDGAASFNDGFVPDNFAALSGGGVPPFGQDFNGILNAETSWDQWYQAGAPISFDATFAAAVGGYPQGAIVDSSIVLGAQWYSTVDSNLTNPDDPLTSVGWARAGVQVGTPVPFLTSTLPPDYVAMNASGIGSIASGAVFSSNSALFLFCFIWANFSNTQCPIFTSGGAPTTRGANPVADFLANKRLAQPSARGLNFTGVDTMGGLTTTLLVGIPVTSGNTTTPGSIVGENRHALVSAENGVHSHPDTLFDPGHTHANVLSDPGHTHTITSNAQATLSNASAQNGGGFTSSTIATAGITAASAATGMTITNAAQTTGMGINNNNSGSGTAHNNVELSMLVFWGQKL